MRILVVSDLYHPPTTMGGPITARRWAQRLAARGHEVTVLAPAGRLGRSIEDDRGTRVLRIPSLPLPHRQRRVRAQHPLLPLFPTREVRRAIRLARPQVAHLHFISPLGQAALAEAGRAGLPVLGTNHSLPEAALHFYGRERAEAVRRVAPRLYAAAEGAVRQMIVRFYNRCGAMTAPTETTIALYRAWGVTVPSHAVSNGADLSLYARAGAPDERVRFLARFGIPADRRIVLYAGRISPEKRVEVLVRGFARIPASLGAHLVIAGSHDRTLDALVAASGLAGRVTTTGFLDPERELPSAYRAADVLASASECEGQGIVFLEAMASGLPVVAVDRYAVSEIVIDGETGFLVPPGDEVALAAALVRVLGDATLSRRLGDEGRRRVAPHDLEHTVDAVEGLLQCLARETPCTPPSSEPPGSSDRMSAPRFWGADGR